MMVIPLAPLAFGFDLFRKRGEGIRIADASPALIQISDSQDARYF
jgi:hypothetical protein